MATTSGHTSAIRARKVIGTHVKDTSGRKIGEIEDVVLDKLSNNILFAVVGFGGFLGMAEKYHPIPWSALDYDPGENSYVVSYTKEQLQAAPAASIDELTQDDGISFRDKAYDYYKAPRYWEQRH
jgi:sporulation protein YlmC with PRC-barrel domain